MRGTRGVIAVILFALFAATTAGAPVEVISPDTDSTYTVQNSNPLVKLNASPNTIVNFTIPSADVSEDVNDSAFEGQYNFPDGTLTLTVWTDDGSTITRTNHEFTLDRAAPKIGSTSPGGIVYDDDVELSAQFEDATSSVDADSVQLQLDGESVNDTDDEINTATHDANDLSEGEHDAAIRVADIHGHVSAWKNWSFTIPKEPVLSDEGPHGTQVGTGVTVGITARDAADIETDESYFDVEAPDGDEDRIRDDEMSDITDVSNGYRFEHELSELADGEYTVTARIEDANGKAAKTSWSFTIDTAAPDVDLDSHADGDLVTGEQLFEADVTDSLSQIERVGFRLSGLKDTTYGENDETYSTTMGTTSLDDGVHLLRVFAYDTAENRGEATANVTIDNTDPELDSIDIYPKRASTVTWFRATATDDVSGIKQIHYDVRNTSIDGVITPEDDAFAPGTITAGKAVDLRDLRPDEYRVEMYAKDAAGHTSAADSMTLTVLEDGSSDVQLSAPDTIQIVTGESDSVTATMQNPGDLADRVVLSTESTADVELSATEKRIGSGERRSVEAAIDTAGMNLGMSNLTIDAAGMMSTASASVTVIVQPPLSEQRRIDDEFETYKEAYEELSATKDQHDEGVNDSAASNELTEMKQVIDTVEEYLAAGRYHAASERLEDAAVAQSEAEQAVTGMVTQYEREQTKQTVLKFFALAAIVAGLVYGYRRMPPAPGYDTESGFIYRPDGKLPLQVQAEQTVKTLREQLRHQYHELTADESDADESPYAVEEWHGFEN